jgi:predicted Rossmann-fold nucleotide-binding protein
VVLIGAAYWRGFTSLLENMVKAGTVSAADLQLFLVTDDLKEALAHIKKYAIEEFGLVPKPPRPSRLLREEAYPVIITDQSS